MAGKYPFHLLSFALVTATVISAQPTAGQESAAAPRMDILSEPEWRQVDETIERALRWLIQALQRDGSFPTDRFGQPGVTTLVTMAFMSQGHTPHNGPFGEQLANAMDYIIACQHPNGLISSLGHRGPIVPHHKTSASTPSTYNHAISGLALSEAYGISGDRNNQQLHEAIEEALRVTLRIQQWPKDPESKGGWRYLNDADSDLSVVGWHLKFLRFAKNAGFDVDQSAIDDAVGYVLRCFNPKLGTFEYKIIAEDRQTRAMAGAGILALAHSGQHHRPEVIQAADWILGHGFDRYNRPLHVSQTYRGDRYHYGVFYCSQAMYQMGGRYWEEFFPTTARVLIDGQNSNGSWDPETNADERFGPVYTTSMAVLALSAPNQLLPIYQR